MSDNKLELALKEAFREGLGNYAGTLDKAAKKLSNALTEEEIVDLVEAIQFVRSKDGYESLVVPGGGMDYPEFRYRFRKVVKFEVEKK